MKINNRLLRNSHFLGTKIRNLRKRNHLTMEDLSARCIQLDAELAPSVSYLSMIERGKRTPSEELLILIAQIFQKDPEWFLDDVPEKEAITPDKGRRGGIQGMALEPSFLFSDQILQIAIPELLSQTGVSGQQFAQLLIRAHQENSQNNFPDLERAAEEVGKKEMPLSLDRILSICKQMDLNIKWFKYLPDEIADESGLSSLSLVRSFFSPPNTIYINDFLKQHPSRLKYDLSLQIGHCVLHNRDGVKSILLAGNHAAHDMTKASINTNTIDAVDMIHAWRDFECSFFAGALLCPKVPFRQLLDRSQYEISVSQLVGASASVVMRRMTAVSPYPHWHYFDAYPPGRLKAVYRGNGIPLPWGNMHMVSDPCQHWSVFRMLEMPEGQTTAQISVLDTDNQPRIYCCESVKVTDLAGNHHVLCAGIDLNPTIESQGKNALDIAQELKAVCNTQGGSIAIPPAIKKELNSAATILNIGWIKRGINNVARLICPRSNACPRNPVCSHKATSGPSNNTAEDIRKKIITLFP